MNYIYKFMNHEDEVIYIGKTIDMYTRMRKHKATKKWEEYKEILYTEVEHDFDCDLLERYMIVKYKPKFNVMHNLPSNSTDLKIEEPKFESWTPKIKDIEDIPQKWGEDMLEHLNANNFNEHGEFYISDHFVIGTNFEGIKERYIVNHFLWDYPAGSTPPTTIDTLEDFNRYKDNVYEKFGHNVY